MKRIWILKMMGKSGPPDEAARFFSMTAMPSVCGESPHGRGNIGQIHFLPLIRIRRI